MALTLKKEPYLNSLAERLLQHGASHLCFSDQYSTRLVTGVNIHYNDLYGTYILDTRLETYDKSSSTLIHSEKRCIEVDDMIQESWKFYFGNE